MEFEKQSENFNDHFQEIRSWALELLNSGSNTTVADVIMKTGVRLFDENTIIDRDWNEGRDILALCGFGTAPDHNLRFRRDSPDEPAVIYELDNKEERLSGLSETYQSALIKISAGSHLLRAEKCGNKETTEILRNVISQVEGLTVDDKKGLEANLQCALIEPHDRKYPKRLGKVLKGQSRDELRQFIIDLSKRNEKVQAKAASVAGKILTEFGLGKHATDSYLHAGEIASN